MYKLGLINRIDSECQLGLLVSFPWYWFSYLMSDGNSLLLFNRTCMNEGLLHKNTMFNKYNVYISMF